MSRHFSNFIPAFAGRAVLLAVLLPGGAALDGAAAQTGPVRQRAVLHEEDVTNPNGNLFPGTVAWRTEWVAAAPGGKPDIVVQADIDIPNKLAARWSIQSNADRDLPASHLVKVRFTTRDLGHGSVAGVRGSAMKDEETARGAALAGMAVKVADNYFLIGLTAVDIDRKRNAELLRQRAWVDVLLVYGDGARAVLTFEKGAEGQRAFADAFAAWEGGR